MPEPRQYVPSSSAKEVQFQGGGSIIKCSFDAQELAEFAKQYQNSNGWITFVIAKRREPSPKGATHSIYLDTWQPKRNGEKPAARPAPTTTQPPDETGVPF